MVLAQTTGAERTGNGLLSVFDYLGRFQMPSRPDFLDGLQSLPTLMAVLLVLAGILYLWHGFRFFKALVIANGAALGGLVGWYLGSFRESPNMPLLMGLAGAVLLGVLAWPAIKYAVGIMGALAGGLAGFALWLFVAHALNRPMLIQHAWAGGLIGMALVGMLAFVAFRPAVMVLTSVQGATMFFAGVGSLLLAHSSISESIKPELVANDFLMTVLIAVPAAAGFTLQFSTETAKIRKKRKATEKPPV